MVLAGAWYASLTFWTAFGALAVVVMGAVAASLTYLIWLKGSPTRHLGYRMSAVSLLPDAAHEKAGGLKTAWNGEMMGDPHILQVTLISRNRQYLGTDDSKPLEFRVRAKIIAILRIDSSPDFSAVAFRDDILKVGPASIGPRQSIKFTLLVDGPDPTLTPPPALHLDIKELSPESAQRGSASTVRWVTGAAVIAMSAVLVLVGFLIHQPLSGGSQQTTGQSQTLGSLQVASADLLSDNPAVQLTGINALQGIIKTSPGDQPNVIQALTKYIRIQSPAGKNDQPVTSNVQAALNVLRTRNPADDGNVVIDLDDTNFTAAILPGIDLRGAGLIGADFSSSQLSGANFQDANLSYAFIGGATLANANFSDANLSGASFYQTVMCNGSVPVDAHAGYNCNPNG
jgi:hypothetical protein